MPTRPRIDPAAKAHIYGRVIPPPSVDTERCTGCGTCKKDCPARVFEIQAKKAVVEAGELCIGCGHCWAMCPERAVTQADSTTERAADFAPDPPFTAEAFEDFLQRRRSVRRFEKTPIEREVLERVVAAAQHAPTGSNAQDVGLIVLSTPEKIDELRRATERFLEGFFKHLANPVLSRLAPAFMGAKNVESMKVYAEKYRYAQDTGRKDPYFVLPYGSAVLVAHHDAKNSMGSIDAVSAIHTSALKAQSEGLASCYVGFVTIAAQMDKATKGLLGLPKGRKVAAAMVLGVPKTKPLRPVRRLGPSVTWL